MAVERPPIERTQSTLSCLEWGEHWCDYALELERLARALCKLIQAVDLVRMEDGRDTPDWSRWRQVVSNSDALRELLEP